MKLYISGGSHAGTDVEARVRNVTEAAESLDVVFLERWDKRVNTRTRIRNWAIAPLLLSALIVYLRLILPISERIFPGGADAEIAHQLETDFSAPILSVDQPVHSMLQDKRELVLCSNWLLVLLSTVPVILGDMSWVYLPFSLFISGFCLLCIFLASYEEVREMYMLERILEETLECELTEGVLITGGRHAERLHNRAENIDGIEPVLVD